MNHRAIQRIMQKMHKGQIVAKNATAEGRHSSTCAKFTQVAISNNRVILGSSSKKTTCQRPAQPGQHDLEMR